jgi:dolichyl-phosphate-mannose-protein mannosyltransferase
MYLKIKIGKRHFSIPYILIILFGGLLLRLFLTPYGTLEVDLHTFIGWSYRLVETGFSKFYSQWSDYLPGYLYILWILGMINKIISISPVFLYKLPAIFSDLLTGYLIYKIVQRHKNERWGVIASSLYLFNPAVFANSSLWGQVDSLVALFSLLVLYFVGTNPIASSLFLAFGTLIKPQTALLAPVVLFIMLKRKWEARKIFRYISVSFLFFVLGFVPFAGKTNLSVFIIDRISKTLSQYPFTSVNAFNLWGLFGFWQGDRIVFQILGLVVTLGLSLFAATRLWKVKKAKYLLLSIVYAASFLFFTRMHERHLFPIFAPLAIAASLNSNLWVPYIGFSLIYVFNLYNSFIWVTQDFRNVFPIPMIIFFIFMNFIFFFLMFLETIKKEEKYKDIAIFIKGFVRKLRSSPKRIKKKEIKLSSKTARIILLTIIVFSLLTRVLGLNNPGNEYFDEVYHAFTAREMLHGNPKAWEWWNTPPEGFAYEWTHPPLAKLGMVLGMVIFGENSFGWRIPGALLGVGSVFLVYLIAKNLFKDEVVGLLSSGIFALGGLSVVMSRIGMNDSYLLFFSLLAVYLFFKDRNFLSALSFGLALSSKWSAVWLVPLLIVSFFVLKKKFKPSYLWFLILPPIVYLLNYMPMFLTGHGFDIFIGVQKQMWWYHTRLKAEHAYTSSWWSWPFMVRPIYLYTSGVVNKTIARIYAMGNPIVFWFGVISILISSYLSFIEKNKKLGLIIFSYFIFFVPWALSPRIMFLYHYLPSTPFLAIASGYVLRRFPKLIMPLITISLIVFLFFFPHLVGIRVPLQLDNLYYWFSSWR